MRAKPLLGAMVALPAAIGCFAGALLAEPSADWLTALVLFDLRCALGFVALVAAVVLAEDAEEAEDDGGAMQRAAAPQLVGGAR
jgi:hypothetical protein